MKVLLITSNSYRHLFFARQLSKKFETMVIMEALPHSVGREKVQSIGLGTYVEEHYRRMAEAETVLFGNELALAGAAEVISCVLGDVNHPRVLEAIQKFSPDVVFSFGCGWIKGDTLRYLVSLPSYNFHLGISPFYRGHSTNFWAYYNGDIQFVGGTILSLDAALDEGDIICHVHPTAEPGDDYYLFSMRSVEAIIQSGLQILEQHQQHRSPIRHTPPSTGPRKYYESRDFTDGVARKFLETKMFVLPALKQQAAHSDDGVFLSYENTLGS